MLKKNKDSKEQLKEMGKKQRTGKQQQKLPVRKKKIPLSDEQS